MNTGGKGHDDGLAVRAMILTSADIVILNSESRLVLCFTVLQTHDSTA